MSLPPREELLAPMRVLVGVVTLALACAILWLTLSPAPDLPSGGFDKLAHLLAFVALVFPSAALRPNMWKFVLPFGLALGPFIELVQPHFGRSQEWADAAADIVGAVVGYLGGRHLARRLGRFAR